MSSNDDKAKGENLTKEEEDKVYEMLQTSSSLLDNAATHKKNMMQHSFGHSMDLEQSFAMGDDDDDDDDLSGDAKDGKDK